MNWLELVFMGSAVIGGTLFLLRMLTMVVGGLDFGDSDIPHDIDGGFDGMDGDLGGDFQGDLGDGGDIDHSSADISFKFLSLQGLTAFFMMFGLVGLALLRANLWALVSIAGGMIAGLFTVWVIGLIFTAMRQLQSSGTIQIKNAIGQSGSVYLTIPASGSGQVQVAVQGSLKIYDAVSGEKKKIATGEKIKVINVIDNKTLVVTKLL